MIICLNQFKSFMILIFLNGSLFQYHDLILSVRIYSFLFLRRSLQCVMHNEGGNREKWKEGQRMKKPKCFCFYQTLFYTIIIEPHQSQSEAGRRQTLRLRLICPAVKINARLLGVFSVRLSAVTTDLGLKIQMTERPIVKPSTTFV